MLVVACCRRSRTKRTKFCCERKKFKCETHNICYWHFIAFSIDSDFLAHSFLCFICCLLLFEMIWVSTLFYDSVHRRLSNLHNEQTEWNNLMQMVNEANKQTVRAEKFALRQTVAVTADAWGLFRWLFFLWFLFFEFFFPLRQCRCWNSIQ